MPLAKSMVLQQCRILPERAACRATLEALGGERRASLMALEVTLRFRRQEVQGSDSEGRAALMTHWHRFTSARALRGAGAGEAVRPLLPASGLGGGLPPKVRGRAGPATSFSPSSPREGIGFTRTTCYLDDH